MRRTEGTEGVRAEVRGIWQKSCGTEDRYDAEDQTEAARGSVEGQRVKEGRGSGRNEGQRQGGREHYSVESDALPENERRKGYHAEDIRNKRL